MKKMRLSFMVLVIAIVAVFAGCSSKGSGDAKESTAPSAKESTAPASAAPSTAVETPTSPPVDEKVDFKGGTLRIGQWWGMENYLSEEEKEKQRLAEEKYNVKIEYVTVPYDQIKSRIITTSVAGQPFADIVMIPTEWVFPKMVLEGYVAPIDDLVDMNRPEWNKVMLNNGKYDGKQYSFTDKDNNGYGFYYNKTLIQKNNLEDPYVLQEKGEWTWAKFLEMTKAVTKDGVFGVVEYGEDKLGMTLPFIYGNNGAVTKDDKITFDSPESLEAIQFVSDMYNVHKVVGGKWGEGTALFQPGARWSAFDWKDSMKDDWGYVFFPMGPKATEYVVPVAVNMWHLMSGVKNPKAVMTVWQELYELDQVKGSDAVIRGEEANFRNQESLDTLRKMLGNGTIMQFYAYEGFEGYMKEAITNIMTGKGTPASELARIKPLTQASIDITLKK